MKRIMLIWVAMVLLLGFSHLVAKEKMILQDVTGDGKAEKIYKKDISFPRTNTNHFRLIIQEKTARGWKNIFPKSCLIESAVEAGKIDCTVFSRNSWGDFGGYFIDKYSDQYPGQQILIYFPCHRNEPNAANYFEAYFFKKEPQDKEFVLYRKDITDGKYQQSPQLAKELKKEFQQETRFAKAHKAVNDFWQTLMTGEASEIDSFLYHDPTDPHSFSILEDSLESYQKQKGYLQKQNYIFYSFNGGVRMEEFKNEILEYIFLAIKKEYRTYIGVDEKTFKITSLYGTEDCY